MRLALNKIPTSLVMATALLLAACAPQATTTGSADAVGRAANLPQMKLFASTNAAPVTRSNAQIARDFIDLSFAMENGTQLPRLTRFEGPIRVAVRGQVPASLPKDLAQLLARLRSEARIDIALARSGEEAQIVVDAIPLKSLQRAMPQAACFVAPSVASFAEFRKLRSRGQSQWAQLSSRTLATVVIPSDMPPQEVRDCLHEEIGQALGPLNDLYRLPDSVFNDDNFHNVLTGFDMLILRAYYAPEMRNGISRPEAQAVLTRLLPRLNPRGGSVRGGLPLVTPNTWNSLIVRALSNRTNEADRIRFANQALRIARDRGWRDNRLAFSLFVQGRVSLGQNPGRAIDALIGAGELYKSLYGPSIHFAHVATQMAAFALTSGEYHTALRITDEALPAAFQAENAAVMATLMLLKAQALERLGQGQAAAKLELDALGWARYGFGSDDNLRRRVNEIRALAPS